MNPFEEIREIDEVDRPLPGLAHRHSKKIETGVETLLGASRFGVACGQPVVERGDRFPVGIADPFRLVLRAAEGEVRVLYGCDRHHYPPLVAVACRGREGRR